MPVPKLVCEVPYASCFGWFVSICARASIFSGGIFFETVLGLVLAAVAFLLSGFLASLYSLPNITPLIQIASFTILATALLSTAQAAFVGMEKVESNSIALIVQAIIKTTVVPVLVIFGLGPVARAYLSVLLCLQCLREDSF